MTKDEARSYFETGYRMGGGDVKKLHEVMDAVFSEDDSAAKKLAFEKSVKRERSDYDDSLSIDDLS